MNKRILAPVAASILFGGCAALPVDRGFGDVQQALVERGARDVHAPGAAVEEVDVELAELTAQPLSVDGAIGIALLRSPVMRAAYAQLGLAQADVLEATRLANPTLSMGALFPNNDEKTRIDYGLSQSFTEALFFRQRGRIASRELERTKRAVAARVQALSADVARAHYEYVGALQVARMREVVATAASASAELARRFFDAGNIDARELNLEQAAAAEAKLAALAATTAAEEARAALNARMGVRAGELAWQVEPVLLEPVSDEVPLDELRSLALEHRLDLAARREAAIALSDVLDLAEKVRWFGFLEVGVEGERETDGSKLIGPAISLQLPLFNRGESSVIRIRAMLEEAQAEVASLEIEIDNELTAVYEGMLGARQRAQLYSRSLVPKREAIVARTLELQNYMIVGQFELLLAKQQEYDAYQGYLEALRDYWLQRVKLARVVGTRLPSDARIGGPADHAISAGELMSPENAEPTPSSHDHHH